MSLSLKINQHSQNIITEIIAALYIFLFVYTAVSKLITHDQFAAVLSASPLLGSVSVLISWMIPLIELLIAVLLFFPTSRRLGLKMSLYLMLAFTIYIAYMIAFTPKLPCACGGVISSLSWTGHLLFNLLFILLAFLGLYPNKFLIAINPSLLRAPAMQAGKAENLYK
jgi:hypothetical protein